MFFRVSLDRRPNRYADWTVTYLVHVNPNSLARWANRLCCCEDIEASTGAKVNHGFALHQLAQTIQGGSCYTRISQLSKREGIAAAQPEIRTLRDRSKFVLCVPKSLGNCLFVITSSTPIDRAIALVDLVINFFGFHGVNPIRAANKNSLRNY
jgi:hypothetical protein